MNKKGIKKFTSQFISFSEKRFFSKRISNLDPRRPNKPKAIYKRKYFILLLTKKKKKNKS